MTDFVTRLMDVQISLVSHLPYGCRRTIGYLLLPHLVLFLGGVGGRNDQVHPNPVITVWNRDSIRQTLPRNFYLWVTYLEHVVDTAFPDNHRYESLFCGLQYI